MQTLILRQWLRRHGVPSLPEQRQQEFLKQLAEAAINNRAEVQWDDWLIKHYDGDLWLHRRHPYLPCPETPWREGMRLELGRDTGCLLLEGKPAAIPPGWRVRARRPGDRLRPHPDGPSRDTNSPSAMVKSMGLTAKSSPNFFSTCWSWMVAIDRYLGIKYWGELSNIYCRIAPNVTPRNR
jgi:hypothetical protein